MRRRWITFVLIGLVLALAPVTQPARASTALFSPAANPPPEFVPGQLIVGLQDDFQIKSLSLPPAVRSAAKTPELEALHAAVVSVPVGEEEAYRKQLVNQPGVLFVEPNYIVYPVEYTPNDPLYPQQWALPHIKAPAAWQITTGSTDVTVAVIDSGIDPTHPEFAGRLLPGYDFIRNTSTLNDPCGHGTHVAGIIAASGDNGEGIAGVDWQAKILPLRVLNDHCSGSVADIARALVYAVDHHGAQVINLSLGTRGPSYLMEASTYYAYRRGAALIAAAGNEGCATGNTVLYPAHYTWTLAVSAVTSSNQPAGFSSCGVQVDLAAPGVGILSTTPMRGYFHYKSPTVTNAYSRLGGTSMAAAHVSGAAALLAGRGFDHPDAIYQALTASALDINDEGKDIRTGHGLLQIDAALGQPPEPPPPAPPSAAVEYDLLSSERCQNIQFDWRNIPHTVGNMILFAPGGNDGSATIPLPEEPKKFSFSYGGNLKEEITISTNGYLSFDAGSSDLALAHRNPENFIIPLSDRLPNHFLAAFWDDLNASASFAAAVYTGVLGTFPNRQFVVEWYRVPIHKNHQKTEVTFQIVLFETSNHIQYQYHTFKGPESDGSSATIGLEYNNGRAGLLYAYNQPGALRNRSAIHFYPRTPGSDRTAPGCLRVTRTGAGGGDYNFAPFCLEMPAGTLDGDATLRISTFSRFPPTPSRFSPVGAYAEITLDPKPLPPLTPPPRLCYRYTTADVGQAGGRPENLFFAVYTHETQMWQRLETSVDREQRRIYAEVPHFSIFGVFHSPMPETPPVTGARFVPQPGWWLLVVGLLAGVLGIWCARRG